LCRNCLITHAIEGKIEGAGREESEKEDASSYWMTIKKLEDTVT
jgi:hypothetical protein